MSNFNITLASKYKGNYDKTIKKLVKAYNQEKDMDMSKRAFILSQLQTLIPQSTPESISNALSSLKEIIADQISKIAKVETQSINELSLAHLTLAYFNQKKSKLTPSTISNLDSQLSMSLKKEETHKQLLQQYAKNPDANTYNALCANAAELYQLIIGQSIIAKDYLQFIHQLNTALSQRNFEGVEGLADKLEKIKLTDGYQRSDLATAFSDWLDIDGIDVTCLSAGNNTIFKLSHNEMDLTFSCSELPQKNADKVYRLLSSRNLSHFPVEFFTKEMADSLGQDVKRYSLMPFYTGGNCEAFCTKIHEDPNLPIDEKQKIVIGLMQSMMQISIGLHEFVYTDIKPSNYLLKGNINHEVIITDIKTLIHVTDKNQPIHWRELVTTPSYNPSEAFLMNDNATKTCEDIEKQQVYMFGISLYQMLLGLTGEALTEIMADKSGICYDEKNNCLLDFNHDIFTGELGKTLKTLIEGMIKPNYEERFSLAHVVGTLQISLASKKKNSPRITPKQEKPTLTRNDARFFNRQKHQVTTISSTPEIKPASTPIVPSISNSF